MKLRKTAQGTVVDIFVKSKSKQFQVKIEDDELIVYCREAPVKGKVNSELIKELSRFFKRRAEIVSGFSSRHKKVLIDDISVEEVNEVLSVYKSE